jgi:hypothetical protein
MWKRVSMIALVTMLTAVAATPVAASEAKVDRIEDFDTVLAVAMPDDFPIASLMRAHCSDLIRVERPDGSATEVMHCELSDEPVMIPEFQGAPPTRAFVLDGPSCLWISDYWGNTQGTVVLAESFRYTVTPSGQVHARSEYPSEPLVCD